MVTDTVCQASLHAAESVLLFIAEREERRSLSLPLLFFKSLATLTKEQALKGISHDKLIYEAKELIHWMQDNIERDIQPENETQYISKQYRDLMKKTLQDDVRLETIALKHELQGYGFPCKVEGGGQYNKNQYYLELRPISEEARQSRQLERHAEIPEAYICYKEQKRKKGPFLARVLDGVGMKGWRLFLFLSMVILPLLIFSGLMLTPLLSIFFPSLKEIMFTFSIWGAMFLGAFFAFFGFIFRLVDKRVAMLPDWVSLSPEYWLLEYRPTKNDAGEYSHRKIALVHYIADCKECSGEVTVGKGGWHFPGRLVGRCNENPVEHVYTFDHVTRVGKPLR